MKLLAHDKSEQNKAALDPWTLVHFATGLATGLMGLSLRWSLVASVAYEGLEQLAEREKLGQRLFKTSRPESLPNVLVDVGVFAAGHALGRRWNSTGADDVT